MSPYAIEAVAKDTLRDEFFRRAARFGARAAIPTVAEGAARQDGGR